MAGIHFVAVIGDKAFDDNWLRDRLKARTKRSSLQRAPLDIKHDPEKYRWRHLVENFFCALKAFRRIATRYEKTDTCFAAMVNVAQCTSCQPGDLNGLVYCSPQKR